MTSKTVKIGGLVTALAVLGLLALFLEFSSDKKGPATETLARVLTVDNEAVQSAGPGHIGHQSLTVRLIQGPFEGRDVPAANLLTGRSDMETLFQVGDKIIVSLILKDGEIQQVHAVDLHRQGSLILLFCLFGLCLILFARTVGIKALISFALTLGIIWKILVPRILAGDPPLLVTGLTLALLSAIIIFLVAGLTRRGLTAFLGTLSGLGITLVLVSLAGSRTGLAGMTQPFVNSLIFSGHYDLDIRAIFYAAVVLGASGAAMDVAVDIAASMDEIRAKRPDISSRELVTSGFTVGRQVMGTMTTTLLLAYSGGYLTLLLFFQAQHPSTLRILNLKIVAAEILRTLVGSMGLVMVAPITAILGGIILTRNRNNN